MATENEEYGPLTGVQTSRKGQKVSPGLRNSVINPIQKSDNMPLKNSEAGCSHYLIGKTML